jgi:hypothetical protein
MSNRWPYILFGIFLVIFTVGIMYGQIDSLLGKAIRICLECIGIG